MESWISVYGLLAALLGMLADVAEFWKTVSSWCFSLELFSFALEVASIG